MVDGLALRAHEQQRELGGVRPRRRHGLVAFQLPTLRGFDQPHVASGLWTPNNLSSEHYEWHRDDCVYSGSNLGSWPTRNSTGLVTAYPYPSGYYGQSPATFDSDKNCPHVYGNNNHSVYPALSASSKQRTMWAVICIDDNSNHTIFSGTGNGSLQWKIQNQNSDVVTQYIADLAQGSDTVPNDSSTFSILTTTFDNMDAEYAFTYNGSADATIINGSGSLVDGNSLSLFYNGSGNGGNSEGMNGWVKDIGYVEGIASSSDIAKIQGYLAAQFGLQSVLPSDHPYKSAAPTV